MSEHHTGPAETGAPMDYPAHEQTYDGFIVTAKIGTGVIVSLMIAMAAGFFSAAGFFGGLLIFLILSAASIILLR